MWLGFVLALPGSGLGRVGASFLIALILAIPGRSLHRSGGSSARSTSSSGQDPYASITPDDVELATLLTDYGANEVAADQRYKGRVIETSGVVGEIKKDILDRPYVLLQTTETEIQIPSLQCISGVRRRTLQPNSAGGRRFAW